MKSQQSENRSLSNKVGGSGFLEFVVHLFEYEYFNPVVFCHDEFWFNHQRYAEIMLGFFNLLSFLFSCGITIEMEPVEPDDIQTTLYQQIMRDSDYSTGIKSYVLRSLDLTCLNVQNAKVPDTCGAEDFAYVVMYLLLKTGSALSRRSVERIFGNRITDTEMITIRKRLSDITGREILKRKDNSYEMR